MSNKTNFKRIALVAVTALGAGILSVSPAYAADAIADDLDISATSGTTNSGACSISTGGQGGTFVVGSTVTMAHTTADDINVAISGPAIFTGGTAVSSGSATITATNVFDTDGTSGETITLLLTGAGTVTVNLSATSTSALVDSFTINSVASCASSTYSAAKSNFTITDIYQTDTDASEGTAWVTAFSGVDSADQNIIAVNGTGYARAHLNNSYGDNLDSKPMVATSDSADCWVDLEDSTTTAGAGTSPASQTAVLTSTGADVTIAVKAAVAGTAAKCNVSLSWNGINVGSKAYILQGVAASVTVSDITVGEVSGSGYYRVTVKDALGNLLPSQSITNDNTEAKNAASLTVVSDASANSASTGTATDASTGAKYGVTPAVTSTTIGNSSVAKYTCTSKGGSAQITVRALQSGITYVTSAPFTVYCGGTTLDTWTMSLDKATYAPGEIATLTVTGKDPDGLLMHSLEAIGTVAQSFGGMTFITAPTSGDLFNSAAGAKTYQLRVDTTTGSYVGSMTLSTATTDSKAETIQYTIKSATTEVTNADVLKSIVSLIASINKQIQALQKLILRR
jgi:hypothetical protein